MACGIEASFTLDKTSRLPRWFTTYEGLSRDDTIVELIEYTDGSARMTLYGSARMSLLGPKGRTLAEVHGPLRFLPREEKKRNATGGFDSDPRYMMMTVGDVVEVLDFPAREPRFLVSDDPILKREAVEAAK